ncbi:MAG: ATP-binding protein [Actinomycetota bacterium]|nr:ATP-binding protein [Actinomycetota bacterium]
MTGGRILIVDDDITLLQALPEALRLRMQELEIDTSETAAEALEHIKETDYDAIVSDIKMPGMDGLALLSEIERLRPRTPTLLITGHGEHDLAVQALRGGAYDFVQKPIDRDYFVASLERAIQMRRADRQIAQQRRALERHARVLENVDDGVFLVDDDGVIQHWNPAAHAITGLPAAAVLGQRAEDALPSWSSIAPTVPVAAAPGPGSLDAKTLPLEIDGKEIWLSISGVRFDEGVVYAFRNLTEERALDELKSEFVATVSHELRTPLAAIYGSAQTLRRHDLDLDDESRERLLEVIAQESERLTRIAGDILLANNLDTGNLRLERQQVDVAKLAREVGEEMFSALTERTDITLEVVAPETLAPIASDGDKLRQVLINLVDNAVKYSPEGGRIEVRVEVQEGRVRIDVSDEGLGISQREQQRIFGKFYRVDPDQALGVGGSGLGLYICRELVRRMEGRLSVVSTEGSGSTFSVELPLGAAAGERDPAVAQTA